MSIGATALGALALGTAATGEVVKAAPPSLTGVWQLGQTNTARTPTVLAPAANASPDPALKIVSKAPNVTSILGVATDGVGVRGETTSGSNAAVYGRTSGNTTTGVAIKGRSDDGTGNLGDCIGVWGETGANHAIYGTSTGDAATVFGVNRSNSSVGIGVLGRADDGAGGLGPGAGVYGVSGTGQAVYGYSPSGIGVCGSSGGSAGYFAGNVTVTGTVSKGGGSFKIDHPLDPANKYLSHSFVESPDMLNVYAGTAELDADGSAWIELPGWFEALNRDYRYQLTAIGAPMPNLHVAQEVADNRFQIAGGAPGKRVSWQVTGIRQDPFANAHRIPVEEEKHAAERGRYLHPELYSQPAEQSVTRLLVPELPDGNH